MASSVRAFQASNDAVATTSHTITLPTHVTGDLLLAYIRFATNTTIVNPAGWTTLVSVTSGGTSGTRLYAKLAASSAETNPVVTSASSKTSALAVSISGHHVTTIGTDVVVAFDAAATVSAAPDPPAVSSFVTGSDLFVAFLTYVTGGTSGSSVTGYPYAGTNNWVTDQGVATITGSTNAVAVAVHTGIKSDPEDTGTFTLSGTGKSASCIRLAIAGSAAGSARLAAYYNQ